MIVTATNTHFVISFQVMKTDWPIGPDSLDELFDWGSYNAKMLLVDCAESRQHRDNFRDLLKYNIWINEAYGGMGTGAYTLHLQHAHLTSNKLSCVVCCAFPFPLAPYRVWFLHINKHCHASSKGRWRMKQLHATHWSPALSQRPHWIAMRTAEKYWSLWTRQIDSCNVIPLFHTIIMPWRFHCHTPDQLLVLWSYRPTHRSTLATTCTTVSDLLFCRSLKKFAQSIWQITIQQNAHSSDILVRLEVWFEREWHHAWFFCLTGDDMFFCVTPFHLRLFGGWFQSWRSSFVERIWRQSVQELHEGIDCCRLHEFPLPGTMLQVWKGKW